MDLGVSAYMDMEIGNQQRYMWTTRAICCR